MQAVVAQLPHATRLGAASSLLRRVDRAWSSAPLWVRGSIALLALAPFSYALTVTVFGAQHAARLGVGTLTPVIVVVVHQRIFGTEPFGA